MGKILQFCATQTDMQYCVTQEYYFSWKTSGSNSDFFQLRALLSSENIQFLFLFNKTDGFFLKTQDDLIIISWNQINLKIINILSDLVEKLATRHVLIYNFAIINISQVQYNFT